MINNERTTRLAFRCNRDEAAEIRRMADHYQRPVSDFIRQAIVIATQQVPAAHKWTRAYKRAIDRTVGPMPWNE